MVDIGRLKVGQKIFLHVGAGDETRSRPANDVVFKTTPYLVLTVGGVCLSTNGYDGNKVELRIGVVNNPQPSELAMQKMRRLGNGFL